MGGHFKLGVTEHNEKNSSQRKLRAGLSLHLAEALTAIVTNTWKSVSMMGEPTTLVFQIFGSHPITVSQPITDGRYHLNLNLVLNTYRLLFISP